MSDSYQRHVAGCGGGQEDWGHETNRDFGGRAYYYRGDRNGYCAAFEAVKWPDKNRAAGIRTGWKMDLRATHQRNLWSPRDPPLGPPSLLDRPAILGATQFVECSWSWRSGRNAVALLQFKETPPVRKSKLKTLPQARQLTQVYCTARVGMWTRIAIGGRSS